MKLSHFRFTKMTLPLASATQTIIGALRSARAKRAYIDAPARLGAGFVKPITRIL